MTPSHGVIRRWLGLLGAYFSAQAVAQVAGVLAGFLLVRYLPLREFALYSLALSAVSFFVFASDLGSTTSLLYFARTARERGDEAEFPRYLAAVSSLRRFAFGLGALGVLAVFPAVALARGFARAETLLATIAILLGVWGQISGSIGLLALRLRDGYRRAYAAEMAGGIVRLAGAALLILVGSVVGWIAVFTNTAGALMIAAMSRVPRALRPPVGEPLARYRREVLRYLAPSLPAALYYSIQGPLVIWLAATFGSTRTIAEVGALGRLAMLFALFNGLVPTLLLPRLSHMTDDHHWRKRSLAFAGLLAALGGGVWVLSLWAPAPFLWILGSRYAGLTHELPFSIAAAVLGLLGAYFVAVNLSRSWNRWEGLAVIVLAASQAALVALFPIGTTAGALGFNVASAAVGLGLQVVIYGIGCVRPERVRWMKE